MLPPSAKIGVLNTIRMFQQEGAADRYNLVPVDFIQVIISSLVEFVVYVFRLVCVVVLFVLFVFVCFVCFLF